MTTGTTDKEVLYWYAEPSVLTHRGWCGDYTHMHTNCMHATLTRTHARTHARNTHTYTRSHARMHAHTSTPHDQHTLSRSSAQPTHACAHIRP